MVDSGTFLRVATVHFSTVAARHSLFCVRPTV